MPVEKIPNPGATGTGATASERDMGGWLRWEERSEPVPAQKAAL